MCLYDFMERHSLLVQLHHATDKTCDVCTMAHYICIIIYLYVSVYVYILGCFFNATEENVFYNAHHSHKTLINIVHMLSTRVP